MIICYLYVIELIKYAHDNDVWFHADKLSSAHVYLRLPESLEEDEENGLFVNAMAWDAIPDDLLEDIAQLTKANSIEGNKKNNINIIYTPASNLKKDGSMEVGQVSFKSNKLVKKVYVETRKNEIVNRLNKTRMEEYPDFSVLLSKRDKELRRRERIQKE